MGTKNSTLVSNFEASPQEMNSAHQLHGVMRVAQGTIALATGDLDASDIVMLAPIPTNASITSIRLASDDLDSATTLTWHVGLHTTAGVAVDADCYATSITLGQAATAFTEYAFEQRDINKTGQRVWQDGGVTADPKGLYYLSMTVATAPTAVAGDIAFIVTYVVN